MNEERRKERIKETERRADDAQLKLEGKRPSGRRRGCFRKEEQSEELGKRKKGMQQATANHSGWLLLL